MIRFYQALTQYCAVPHAALSSCFLMLNLGVDKNTICGKDYNDNTVLLFLWYAEALSTETELKCHQ